MAFIFRRENIMMLWRLIDVLVELKDLINGSQVSLADTLRGEVGKRMPSLRDGNGVGRNPNSTRLTISQPHTCPAPSWVWVSPSAGYRTPNLLLLGKNLCCTKLPTEILPEACLATEILMDMYIVVHH